MIALVDYGAGNLTSVRKAFTAVGASLYVPSAASELARAEGIVIPGVGHFAATAALDYGWREAIRAATERAVPLLGICLGMQWLYEGSEEAPHIRGLGVLRGTIFQLRPTSDGSIKVPHVGWNTVDCSRPSRLLEGVSSGSFAYFTHSYAAPVTDESAAIAIHGCPFAAVVERDRVFGVQFHPEKSSNAGLRILRNFAEVVDSGGAAGC